MAGVSLRRVLAVARKELIHLRRDRRMLPLVFVAPLLQLVILAMAANFDVMDVPALVLDEDRTATSRAMIARLDAGEAFNVVGLATSQGAAEQALEKGEAEVVVVIPRGMERTMARGEPASLPLWLDGTDTNRALMASRYVDGILAEMNMEAMAALVPSPATKMLAGGVPEPRPRVLYNPTFQSRWFMVPAVLAMVLTVMTMLLSALAIVKERENGTIEQLAVTPLRPGEILVGKLAPFVAIGLVVGGAVTFVAVLVFQVPFRGNLLDLAVMGLLYIASTLAFGLLASTVSRTQQQAMLAAILILLPSFLLGGLMYPVGNMEPWAQAIADTLPIRYFISMLRGVFLKGTGMEVLFREVLILGGLGLFLLTTAILGFRKRSS